MRKLQYISELERSVTSLQVREFICGFCVRLIVIIVIACFKMLLYFCLKAEVSVLSPRVAFLDHQRLLLNVDNSALKQRIAALAQDKIFKDGKQIIIQLTKIYFH